MDEDGFWRLIESFDWEMTGDDKAVVEPAVSALAALPIEDIERFEEILAEKLYLLDTKAHAKEIGEAAYREGSGFSSDEFLYSRCVVVANGRKYFEAVLANPRAMPKDMEFESLLYVARVWAHERQTGEPLEHATRVSYETFSNRQGWEIKD